MTQRDSPRVGVIGLGYVGLPLAEAFAEKYGAVGFDIDREKVERLRREGRGSLRITWDEAELDGLDFLIIAVPTPVDGDNKPDLGPLREASRTAARHLGRGTLVVYESTVYPGATEEVCVPILEAESGLKCGPDFQVGYSPERINPGDRVHTLERVVKLVSAMDPETLERMAELYASVIGAGVCRVSSIRAAEAAKIMENAQRDVNIAFMNEMAAFLRRLGLDPEEVRRAAGTKWNFLPFRPGLVGGHCIAVDPYYLIEQGARAGCGLPLLRAARKINDGMPEYLAGRVLERLEEIGLPPGEARAAILGFTYKEDVPDTRNSKALVLAELLRSRGVGVLLSDPAAAAEGAVPLDEVRDADVVIFAVAHREYRGLTAAEVKGLLKPGRDTVFDLQDIFSDRELRQAGLRRFGI